MPNNDQELTLMNFITGLYRYISKGFIAFAIKFYHSVSPAITADYDIVITAMRPAYLAYFTIVIIKVGIMILIRNVQRASSITLSQLIHNHIVKFNWRYH